MLRTLTALLLFFFAGCQGGASGQAVTAAVMAANIGAAAAVNRSSGGCYTQCAPGTYCNRQSGLCDTLPCRGECRADQFCDEAGLVPRCVNSAEGFAIRPGPSDAGTALITPE